MNKALEKFGEAAVGEPAGKVTQPLDWRRKISDHIAYSLLAYTGLQIWVTMTALKSTTGSIMPYFALVILVAAIIPGCRMFERRWKVFSDEEAADPELAPAFRRDRLLVWLAGLSLPFLISVVLKGISLLF